MTIHPNLPAGEVIHLDIKGLPVAGIAGDVNGLRLGVPEIVRLGMGPEHMPALAGFIRRALLGNDKPEAIAADVKAFRRGFTGLKFVR